MGHGGIRSDDEVGGSEIKLLLSAELCLSEVKNKSCLEVGWWLDELYRF